MKGCARRLLARRDVTAVVELRGYRAGRFAQILEGPELNVLDTYMRIVRDSRHSSPTLVTISMTTGRPVRRLDPRAAGSM